MPANTIQPISSLVIQRLSTLFAFVLYCLFACNHSASGQETRNLMPGNNDTAYVEMGEVLIRPAFVRQVASQFIDSVPVSVIRQSALKGIGESLRSVASVDIRQRGPYGVQTDAGIRGGSFDQVMVLLNGINFTDPQTGHNNLCLPVDISEVGALELLAPTSALRYGAQALSGAINIITGIKERDKVRSSFILGAYDLMKTSVSASGHSDRLSHLVSFSAASSGGYRKNTDFNDNKIYFQSEYRHRSGKYDFQAGFVSKKFGANSFYSLKFPDQFESLRTGIVSIKYESNTRVKFSPALYLRTNTDRFELIRNNDSIPFNHHRTTVAGMNIVISSEHSFGTTSFGADIRNEQIISNLLGHPLEINRGLYNMGYSRSMAGINAEHAFTVKNLYISAAILAKYNPDVKTAGLYPALHSTWRIGEDLELFASAGKTMRMPTFTDMFYKSPVQSGNRSLGPEKASSVETGLSKSGRVVSANVSLFRRKVYNMIDWTKDPSPDSIVWRSMNHGDIIFRGVQMTVAIHPAFPDKNGKFRISYAFLDADRSAGMLSKYAFDFVRHKITSGFDLRIIGDIQVTAEIIMQDRNNFYQDLKGNIMPYEPYWLCDIKVFRQFKNYTLHFEASNLFNSEYFDYGGIPQPGTWVSGGISIDANFKK